MRLAVLSDIHFPEHSVIGWNFALSVLPQLNIDKVLLLGDIIDFTALSRFEVPPDRRLQLQHEFDVTKKQLKRLRETLPNTPIEYKAGNHECLADGTEVLTKDGFIPFHQLTLEHLIAAVRDDGSVDWVKPEKIHAYDYDGEMVHINSQRARALMTPNHRLWVKRRYADSWEFLIAENLTNVRCTFRVACHSNLSEYKIEDDMLRILGWYATDGGLHGASITLYQSKPQYIEEITSLLLRLDISHSYSSRQRDITHIAGKALKNPPLPCGEFRLHKETAKKIIALFPERQKIPHWMHQLSDRQVQVFLDALIAGNGSIRKDTGTPMLYGGSKFLDEVQALLVTHNIACSKSTYFDHLGREQYRLNICYRPVHTPDYHRVSPVSKEQYSGKVWCVTIPHGKFIIRYDGRSHVTGNSHLNRFLYNKAPELFGLDKISIRGFCELDQLDIQWIKPEKILREGRLLFLHGDDPRVGGQYPARNLYLKVSDNLMAGHFHKFDRYFHRLAGGKTHGAFINGCLRSLQPDWQKWNHWMLGFSVITLSPGGYFHVEEVMMFPRGSFLWTSVGGREFSSSTK